MKNVNLIYLIDFTFWDLVHIMVGKRCDICILPHNIFSSIRCVMHPFLLARLSPKAELFFACMVVIILSILYISIPLIILSDQEYIKTQQVLTEITSLHALVKTANKISRERAPATSWCWASQMNWKTTGENYRHSGRWWMRKSMKPSSHYRKMALIQSHCNWVRI